MKKLNKLFYLSLAIAFVVGSCTVERRLHNSGYHVTWKKNNHSSEKNDFVQNEVDGNEKSVQKVTQLCENKAIVTSENEKEITSNIERNEEVVKNPSSINRAEESKSLNRTVVANKKQSSHSIVKSVAKHTVKKATKKSEKSDDTELILLYILCILLPPVAVGLVTNWDTRQVLLNILLCLLCGIPGIIHAFIVVSDNR